MIKHLDILPCPECGGAARRKGNTFVCNCGWKPPELTAEDRDRIVTECPNCKRLEFKATHTQNIDPAKRRKIRRCDWCSYEEYA